MPIHVFLVILKFLCIIWNTWYCVFKMLQRKLTQKATKFEVERIKVRNVGNPGIQMGFENSFIPELPNGPTFYEISTLFFFCYWGELFAANKWSSTSP